MIYNKKWTLKYKGEVKETNLSKKIKEYTDWKKNEGANINTPDELIALIQEAIKKARG